MGNLDLRFLDRSEEASFEYRSYMWRELDCRTTYESDMSRYACSQLGQGHDIIIFGPAINRSALLYGVLLGSSLL